MLLFLLRHGDAQSDPSIPDEDRALTPEGVASIRRIAEILRRLGVRFDMIYSSPLLRARQTAELAIAPLAQRPTIRLTDHLKVGADVQNLFDILNAHPADARLLLVGHEPYFSQAISMLLVGNFTVRIDIRKASLACVETSAPLGPRTGTLKWVLTQEIAALVP